MNEKYNITACMSCWWLTDILKAYQISSRIATGSNIVTYIVYVHTIFDYGHPVFKRSCIYMVHCICTYYLWSWAPSIQAFVYICGALYMYILSLIMGTQYSSVRVYMWCIVYVHTIIDHGHPVFKRSCIYVVHCICTYYLWSWAPSIQAFVIYIYI